MIRVVVGSKLRVLRPEVSGEERVISGEEVIRLTASELRLYVRGAKQLIFASYCLGCAAQLDVASSSLIASRVAETCVEEGVPVLFLSTDAVFSGKRGMYSVTDAPNAETAYGQVKLSQERIFAGQTILRFTTFGPSFSNNRKLLLEMLQTQKQFILYPNAYFSPISTITLNSIIKSHYDHTLSPGVHHLASTRISKAEFAIKVLRRLGRMEEVELLLGSESLDLSLVPTMPTPPIEEELDLVLTNGGRVW